MKEALLATLSDPYFFLGLLMCSAILGFLIGHWYWQRWFREQVIYSYELERPLLAEGQVYYAVEMTQYHQMKIAMMRCSRADAARWEGVE